MFCFKCGAACDDTALFCNACGNKLQEAPQAPAQPEPQPVYQQPVYEQPAFQQPAYQQPVYQQPAPAPVQVREPIVYKPLKLNVAGGLNKASHFIALGVAVMAFLLFILNTFCILKVSVSGALLGETISVKSKIGSLSEGTFTLYVGNILNGLINLAVMGVGLLYFLRKIARVPAYDMIVGKLVKLGNPLFLMCGVGLVAGFQQVLFFLLAGGENVVVGVHWINWLAMAIYAIVGVADLVAQGKKD